jgi:hypothetical protein
LKGEVTERTVPLRPPPLPADAEEVLRPDHPLLAEYERRYEGHRANSGYVWQQWDAADPFRYGLTTYYTRLHDRLGLFEKLDEDGLFGAETYDVDGIRVSRDVLDSINELTFLDDELGISQLPSASPPARGDGAGALRMQRR